jgi:hypothetical protein
MEWISVKDRLPEHRKDCLKHFDDISNYYLVCRNEGVEAVMEARFIAGKFITERYGKEYEFTNPTHWRPLPEPPKETE